MFRVELAIQGPYKACIGNIRLRLQELQKDDVEAQKIKMEKYES